MVRFDSGYHEMKKLEVQDATIAGFAIIRIPLATRYREPVVAFGHPKTKNWLGFLKANLLNPNLDALALFRGDRIFTLQM